MRKLPTSEELKKELTELKRKFKSQISLDFTGALLIEIDVRGNVTHVNKKACEILGYKEEEILGKNWFDNFLPEKNKKIVGTISKKLLTGVIEANEHNENLVLTKSGQERSIRWHNAIKRDEKGTIIGHFSSGEDITDRRKAEENLTKALDIIERSPSVVFLWSNQENWPVTYVSNNVHKIFGYTSEEFLNGNISYMDITHPDDVNFVQNEVKIHSESKTTSFSHKPYRIITKNGKIKWVKDNTQIRRNSKGEVTHYEGIILDITESKKTEDALIESENKFHSFTSQSSEGISVADLKGNYTYVNSVFCLMLGWTKEELLKMNVFDVTADKKDKATFKKTKTTNEGIPVEVVLVRKDGTEFIAEVTGKVLNINNRKSVLGTIRDITKKKKVEKDLKESEIRFKTIIENAGDAMYMANFKGEIIDVNNLACTNLGYSRKELLAMNITEVDANFIELEKAKEFWRNLAPRKPLKIETKHKRKDGSVFPVEIRIGVATINNIKVTLGFARNISDRKQSETALKESESLLKEAQEIAQIGHWELNLISNTLTWSDEVYRIFNFKPQEFQPTYASFMENIHPKDRDKVNNAYLDSLSDQQSFEISHRVISKLNEIKYVVEKGITEYNEEGKPVRSLGTIQDITARKQAEQKLGKAKGQIVASEKKFRELYEKSGDAILIGKNGKLIDFNIAAIKMFGYASKKEFLKVHPSKLYPEIQPDGQNSFEKSKKMFRLCVEKGTHRFEWIHRKKNGKLFPVEILLTSISTKPNHKEIHGVLRDITDRKKAEKKLKQNNLEIKEKNNELVLSENRFRSLFNQNPVSLWEEDVSEVLKILKKKIKEVDSLKQYLDENPDFVYECASKIKVLNVNDSTLDLLGVKTKEELISNLSQCFNSKSFETLKEELVALSKNKKEFKRETEFIRKDGKVITVILELVIIGDSRVIVSMNDVTQLKEAKRAAEESDQLKTEFINNMSHEIRTPMNGILGFSELLGDPKLVKEKRAYFINIIKNSGNQLLQVIDDILEISRLGTKQVKVINEPVNINDLLLELFSIFDPKAKENKTPLYLKKGLSDKRSSILTDRFKLHKIISNLLENALKFTNVGSIEFGYQLDTKRKPTKLEIYIKDTGVGIKPEDQKLIFERFAQAEKEESKKVRGLGLGLSIAKENTELLGGQITVESRKGKGTTFVVSIPYNPVYTAIETVDSNSKHTILIAEDEEVNYLYLETLLKDVLNLKCTLIHAKNGKEAINICNNNPTIDLILMDLKMPKISGYEAAKKIKTLYPNIPIIAQTAYSTKEEEKRALEAGCDDFISKPINQEELFNLISKFVPQL